MVHVVQALQKILKGMKANLEEQQNSSFDSRYFTVREFSEISGYNQTYVYRLTSEGRLASYMVGKQVRIPVPAAVQFGSKSENSKKARRKRAMIVDDNGQLKNAVKQKEMSTINA